MEANQAPPPSQGQAANRDIEHLRLLTIFHYVVAGLTALCGCLPIFHLLMGIAMVTGQFPGQPGAAPPPRIFGWIFVVGPALIICAFWVLAVLNVCAGTYLTAHRRYTFCLVIAAADCVMLMPWGTVLGVFTLIVLLRPSVKDLFAAARTDDASAGDSP